MERRQLRIWAFSGGSGGGVRRPSRVRRLTPDDAEISIPPPLNRFLSRRQWLKLGHGAGAANARGEGPLRVDSSYPPAIALVLAAVQHRLIPTSEFRRAGSVDTPGGAI